MMKKKPKNKVISSSFYCFQKNLCNEKICSKKDQLGGFAQNN